MRVWVEVHGCASNQADGEAIVGQLVKQGYELAEGVECADALLLLTCSVKVPTVQRMLHRLNEMNKLNKPLVIGGCLAKNWPELLRKNYPKASLLGPDSVHLATEAIKLSIQGERVEFLEDLNLPKLGLPRRRRNPAVAIVPIARGCLQSCTYCAEPYKGKLLSYPLQLIVQEVRCALKEGCKEVWLCSLDNACYGIDLGTDLAELLQSLCELKQKFWIRVGMASPHYLFRILPKLLRVYAEEHLFKFLHLPLQSGSERVLGLMGRQHSLQEFESIVQAFRSSFECMTLASDLIVGFPTETEQDFELSLRAVERYRFDVLNISKFGSHPSTPAAELPSVDACTVKQRCKQLVCLAKRVSLELNREWLDWQGECLVDEQGKGGTWVARNFAYKPIVLRSEEDLLGKWVEVRVRDCTPHYLLGELI